MRVTAATSPPAVMVRPDASVKRAARLPITRGLRRSEAVMSQTRQAISPLAAIRDFGKIARETQHVR